MNYEASKNISEKDRISPSQPEGRRLYQGSDETYAKDLLAFCRQSKMAILPELLKSKSERFTLGELATVSLQVNFIKFFINFYSCKKVLEIGTFIGSTALAIAEHLPEEGRVTTIELGQEFADIARSNFEASIFGHKIKLIEGDAMEVLKTINNQTFDFVYLDGAKQLYPQLFKLVSPLITEGGLLIIDDVFLNGDAINAYPTTDKGRGVKEVVKLVTADPKWSTSILPVFNGMLLATKIKNQ